MLAAAVSLDVSSTSCDSPQGSFRAYMNVNIVFMFEMHWPGLPGAMLLKA